MAAMAIAKPCNKRGNLWFHRHNPRRARGDNCHERSDRDAPRRVVLEQLGVVGNISEQLDDPVSGYDELEPEPHHCSVDFRRPAQRWVKTRRKEERHELEEHEALILRSREDQLHRLREKVQPYLERRRRMLKRLVADLEALDSLSAAAALRLIDAQVELCSIEILLQY